MSANANSDGTEAASAAVPELVITRVFDAPRPLVFAAWTEQEHLRKWECAPMGFTVTTEESDIRVGGRFRICMHAPDGTDHWLQGVYTEIAPPERLSFTHAWLRRDGTLGIETVVTITFVARGSKTELTLRQSGFDTPASHAGHTEGWNSTFDRLVGYLSTQNSEESK
ncbi:MAG: SRPBCC domain-containing protein [Gemmatimonadaceae bacterium]